MQLTIIGTGLIGGSLGLALRSRRFRGTIVGCDKPEVLETALAREAIDRGSTDPKQAVRGSDIVVLATPVGAILSLLETLAPILPSSTLITDTGSTKQQVVERARLILGAEAGHRVLPGHPMAGKEHGGIEHADGSLFEQAPWLLTPIGDGPLTTQQQEFKHLLETVGARTMTMDAERHDQLCAWVSHLPQMISTALAAALREELGDDDAATQIGGRALREMTRIAHSPYSMWRDIALTNTQNIEDALLRFEQQVTQLRENLRGPGLREMFDTANQFGEKK